MLNKCLNDLVGFMLFGKNEVKISGELSSSMLLYKSGGECDLGE